MRIETGAGGVRLSAPDPDPLLGLQLEFTGDLRTPFTALAVPPTRAGGFAQWIVGAPAKAAEFFRLVVTMPAF